MGYLIIVLISSFLITAILNKISEYFSWKNKVEKYVDNMPYIKIIPIILIVGFVLSTYILPRLGFSLNLMIIIQVVVVSVAGFLFELFR